MSEKITFVIPGDPPRVTAQEKGQNRATGAYYKPQKLRDAEDLYYLSALAHRPPRPIQGPVELRVVFAFRAGESHRGGEYKTTKPDTDNMIKALKDMLTRAGYWKDDAQVAVETVIKLWRTIPGIQITVTELPKMAEVGREDS